MPPVELQYYPGTDIRSKMIQRTVQETKAIYNKSITVMNSA